MKAVVYTKYGSPEVLHLADVEKPVPKDDEVLLKIQASSVNWADWHNLRADPFLVRLMAGLFKPKDPILGIDTAGRIEAVGRQVTEFKPGDAVFGDLYESGLGGFAEYVCAPAKTLAPKPANLTFEEAAAVPAAALTALQGLRDQGQVQPGQKVLINGASGGVGTFAVQIAKSLGADVTAVCSTRNMNMIDSLGADQVIDYTEEDFSLNGQRYDLILDNVGDPAAYKQFFQRSLTPQGRCVIVAALFTCALSWGRGCPGTELKKSAPTCLMVAIKQT